MTALDANAHPSPGVAGFKSPHSFDETVRRLQAALAEHGIKIFAVIDQQAEAKAAGLSMPPMVLILFGNPKGGTPLMVANPQAGIDLPLKLLISESQPGQVEVFLNTADYIIHRHALPAELKASIAPVERLIASALGE